jgi:hypothetical protein
MILYFTLLPVILSKNNQILPKGVNLAYTISNKIRSTIEQLEEMHQMAGYEALFSKKKHNCTNQYLKIKI